MNYQQTLDYLFARLPMFSRIGAEAIKKDLTNTRKLCAALGNPENALRTIHVAGTNGKGSVSHMLAAIFQSAGYKTGLYTSPHLHDFRERIKVNGIMIGEDDVVNFTKTIQPHIETVEPSFFEITVAMAFDYFAKQAVDIAIIETGLGGRLDSTNIIAPELSIITNIGWDHMQLLGNTLPEIAFEKAGIIKKDTPVVIGEAIPETRTVFEAKVKQENAAIYFSEEYFKTVSFQHADTYLEARIKDCRTGIEKMFEMDLQGSYQLQNLQTVLTAASLLEKMRWKITDASIHDALKNTRNLNGLHGRWEKLRSRPDIIIDVAHNEDGMRAILQQLQQMHYAQLHIVIGMVKDKDIDRVLHLMPPHAHYYFTRAQIPRALPEEALRIQAMEKRLEGNAFPDVNSALEDALTKAKEDDLILVCGSVFIAGEVKRELFGK